MRTVDVKVEGSDDFAERLSDAMLNPVREIGMELARHIDELKEEVRVLAGRVEILENRERISTANGA